MDNRGSKPWKKPISSQCPAHRKIQPHCPHTTPTLKGANSVYPVHKQQSVEYNRPDHWNSPSQPIRVDGSGRITLRNRRFLRKLGTPVTPHPILSPSNGTPILERDDESKTVKMHHSHPCHRTVPTSQRWQCRPNPLELYPVCSHTTNQDWKNLSPPKDHCPWGEGEI